MFETLRNVWKIEELRKKVLYTVFMLILYRLLCVVPVPGVDLASVQEGLETFSLLQFMNSITGSNLQMYTIMAMGISPYINASIIMQLLTVAIPKLEEMNKSGEEGRKKIAQITRYVTVALGFLQAVALTSAIGAQASGGTFGLITIGFCMAAGTALAMWIGERITENGIGNGISLLIFAGIISNFANQIAVGAYNAWHMPSYLLIALPVLIISLVLIVAVTCVDLAERRVPVQYAKRVVGRKMYGGQSTHLPMKVNMSGVLPIIFAQSIASLPATICAFVPKWQSSWIMKHVFDTTTWPYIVLYFLLIIFFSYFYSTIQFNPIEVANNLKKNGGFIPGFRAGKPTSEFIQKVLNKITLFGAIYLSVIAITPLIISACSQAEQLTGISLGGTSIIIVVGVALETVRALEAQMLMRNYKGFLS